MLESLRDVYTTEVGVDWTDKLTGLLVRGAFRFVLDTLAGQSAFCKGGSQLFLFEIESLVPAGMNEHICVDLAFRRAAKVISERKRPQDIAGRENLSSFAVFLPCIGREDSHPLFTRWVSAVSRALEGYGRVHAGAAECFGENPEEWVTQAARNLWSQKSGMVSQSPADTEPSARTDEEHFRVLVVDDDAKNRKLLNVHLQSLGYDVLQAENGHQALRMAKAADVDLVLLDIMMPDMSGYDVCAKLKAGQQTHHVPVVFLTVLDERESRLKGIEAGGDAFLVKPPDPAELSTCLLSLIRTRTMNRTFTSIDNVLYSLAMAVDTKDHYTRGHTDRVMNLATDLASWLSYTKQEIEALRLAGRLHDIGKIGIPSEILNKKGELTENEWLEMKKHPDLGYQICLPLKHSLGEAMAIIRHHHEKIDGSAYPDGLSGTQLSRGVRLMTVVDMYDALSTDRPYRNALTQEKTFEILSKEAKQEKIDIEIVRGLQDMIRYRDLDNHQRHHEDTERFPNILVIENDPLNTKKIRKLLRNLQIRVFECANAEEGIRLAFRLPPDLVLIDMHLPGMDGMTGAKIMKSDPRLSGIPIIATSASASQKEIAKCVEAGCTACIEKSIQAEELTTLVLNILAGKNV